jgi:hypothetical protein
LAKWTKEDCDGTVAELRPGPDQWIAVDNGRPLLPGTFEHALNYLIDHEVDLERFAERYRNGDGGAPAYDPAVLPRLCCLPIRAESLPGARARASAVAGKSLMGS